jgi:hypothetical protein
VGKLRNITSNQLVVERQLGTADKQSRPISTVEGGSNMAEHTKGNTESTQQTANSRQQTAGSRHNCFLFFDNVPLKRLSI